MLQPSKLQKKIIPSTSASCDWFFLSQLVPRLPVHPGCTPTVTGHPNDIMNSIKCSSSFVTCNTKRLMSETRSSKTNLQIVYVSLSIFQGGGIFYTITSNALYNLLCDVQIPESKQSAFSMHGLLWLNSALPQPSKLIGIATQYI